MQDTTRAPSVGSRPARVKFNCSTCLPRVASKLKWMVGTSCGKDTLTYVEMNWFHETQKCIYIISQRVMTQMVKILPRGRQGSVDHVHSCRWPREARNQCISGHGIDIFIPELSGVSTRRVTYCPMDNDGSDEGSPRDVLNILDHCKNKNISVFMPVIWRACSISYKIT